MPHTSPVPPSKASGAGSGFTWDQFPGIEGTIQQTRLLVDSPETAFKTPDAWTSFTLIKIESPGMRPRHWSFVFLRLPRSKMENHKLKGRLESGVSGPLRLADGTAVVSSETLSPKTWHHSSILQPAPWKPRVVHGQLVCKGEPKGGSSIFGPKGSYGCLCEGRTHRNHVHRRHKYRRISVNAPMGNL